MTYRSETLPLIQSNARFSEDRVHRYVLRRIWDLNRRTLNVIGLNPSTADESLDDPTIRRCVGFARDWNYGGLVMTNLFSYRATDPAALKRSLDPTNGDNMVALVEEARWAGMVLAAWGVHGSHRGRAREVMEQLTRWAIHPVCLGVTKDGSPRHPLYVAASTRPLTYEVPDA